MNQNINIERKTTICLPCETSHCPSFVPFACALVLLGMLTIGCHTPAGAHSPDFAGHPSGIGEEHRSFNLPEKSHSEESDGWKPASLPHEIERIINENVLLQSQFTSDSDLNEWDGERILDSPLLDWDVKAKVAHNVLSAIDVPIQTACDFWGEPQRIYLSRHFNGQSPGTMYFGKGTIYSFIYSNVETNLIFKVDFGLDGEYRAISCLERPVGDHEPKWSGLMVWKEGNPHPNPDQCVRFFFLPDEEWIQPIRKAGEELLGSLKNGKDWYSYVRKNESTPISSILSLSSALEVHSSKIESVGRYENLGWCIFEIDTGIPFRLTVFFTLRNGSWVAIPPDFNFNAFGNPLNGQPLPK